MIHTLDNGYSVKIPRFCNLNYFCSCPGRQRNLGLRQLRLKLQHNGKQALYIQVQLFETRSGPALISIRDNVPRSQKKFEQIDLWFIVLDNIWFDAGNHIQIEPREDYYICKCVWEDYYICKYSIQSFSNNASTMKVVFFFLWHRILSSKMTQTYSVQEAHILYQIS